MNNSFVINLEERLKKKRELSKNLTTKRNKIDEIINEIFFLHNYEILNNRFKAYFHKLKEYLLNLKDEIRLKGNSDNFDEIITFIDALIIDIKQNPENIVNIIIQNFFEYIYLKLSKKER